MSRVSFLVSFLLLAASAYAHVSILASTNTAKASQYITFTIPHSEAGYFTTRFEIDIPPQGMLTSCKPEKLGGWDITIANSSNNFPTTITYQAEAPNDGFSDAEVFLFRLSITLGCTFNDYAQQWQSYYKGAYRLWFPVRQYLSLAEETAIVTDIDWGVTGLNDSSVTPPHPAPSLPFNSSASCTGGGMTWLGAIIAPPAAPDTLATQAYVQTYVVSSLTSYTTTTDMQSKIDSLSTKISTLEGKLSNLEKNTNAQKVAAQGLWDGMTFPALVVAVVFSLVSFAVIIVMLLVRMLPLFARSKSTSQGPVMRKI